MKIAAVPPYAAKVGCAVLVGRHDRAVISDVEVRPAGGKGRGVYARRDFTSGEFIFRRRQGPAIPDSELSRLTPEERMHVTELDFDTSAVLLPPGCYLNHSCDPNAMRNGVKVFAWQPIAAGDEITIDYRLNAFDDERWPCLCGSPTCTGEVVGSFFAMSDDRQRSYLPYAPAFIRREYRRRHGNRRSTEIAPDNCR